MDNQHLSVGGNCAGAIAQCLRAFLHASGHMHPYNVFFSNLYNSVGLEGEATRCIVSCVQTIIQVSAIWKSHVNSVHTI